MPPAGFETTVPVSERPQTYALDRAATGTGNSTLIPVLFRDRCVYIINYMMLKTEECVDRLLTDYYRREIWKDMI
jgi:hypothetical protein